MDILYEHNCDTTNRLCLNVWRYCLGNVDAINSRYNLDIEEVYEIFHQIKFWSKQIAYSWLAGHFPHFGQKNQLS